MVSKARLDLPEPDSPVITISASLGSSRETSLRLCSRAPEMTILSETGTNNESTQANRCSPALHPTVPSVAFAFRRAMRSFLRTRLVGGGDSASSGSWRVMKTHHELAALAARQYGVVSHGQLN